VRLIRRQRAPADSLLAFVHIPKTAGATITTMLINAYSPEAVMAAGNFVRGPERTVQKLSQRSGGWERWHDRGGRVTVGHVPYGVFREHLPPDARYMTFLREPVDRVLSHYYRHHHRRDPSRAGRTKKRPGARVVAESLEQALVEMSLPQLSNLATRFLCGDPSPMGELGPGALDDAKANLRDFAFIGIQEQFEESLQRLQELLGVGAVPYEDRHVSSNRPAVEEISDRQRALIVERNELDIELYDFALELLEASAGPPRSSTITDPQTGVTLR
jgi:Sulfotransferase family